MKERTIVFFDGDCLLCQEALTWLNRLDSRDRLSFAPLNGETARGFEIAGDDDSMALGHRGQVYRASEAARLACKEAGGIGIVLAGLAGLVPLTIRNRIYYLVARNRKRLFRKASCGIPEEGLREKILP